MPLTANGILDRASLQGALWAQGDAWFNHVTTHCPHLFSDATVSLSRAHLQQMRSIIVAVERIVALPGWLDDAGSENDSLGVFYGYDFHVNEDGAHLIEINTNAGGAFLNALLTDSQRAPECQTEFETTVMAMFKNEWQRLRGNRPLRTLAIVDEAPENQYLYPEFLLAQGVFERSGIRTFIADPSAFTLRADGLYLGSQPIDLIYNRLTDFSLQRYPALQAADLRKQVVLTPNPRHFARYADKQNLVRLSSAAYLDALGVDKSDQSTLRIGLPETIAVHPDLGDFLWNDRKRWFFKPQNGFGSKGAYRGDKLTKRVFAEILSSAYVAQRLAPPGEVAVSNDNTLSTLKFDVRCYVYSGQIQSLAARVYQGQTTNFRTPGGGFALVNIVDE